MSKYVLNLFLKTNFIKSFIINWRLCGFKNAIYFPILLGYGTKISLAKGARIVLPTLVRPALCTIEKKCSLVMKEYSEIKLKGNGILLHENTGIFMMPNSVLELGHHFNCNKNTSINVGLKMVFGNNVLFSANALIYDTDFHSLYNENKKLINPNAPVLVGNNVWFGNRVTVLKGTEIADNVVFGAGSIISGVYKESNAIYAGFPAKLIKCGITWDYQFPTT